MEVLHMDSTSLSGEMTALCVAGRRPGQRRLPAEAEQESGKAASVGLWVR